MAVQSDKEKQPANPGKENRKLALNVFLWTIFAAVLNLIIYMSLTMIFSGLATKNIGESIYEKSEDGSVKLVTKIIYDETTTAATGTTSTASTAVSTSAAKTGTTSAETSVTSAGSNTAASATGTTVTGTTLASNQYKQIDRSKMPAGASLALDILSQAFMLILLVAMVYSKLWERGDKDNNSVNFKRMQEDKLRGLKVGLMAAIPSFLFFVVLIISKIGLITKNYFYLYRFLNISFMPIITRLTGQGSVTSADLSWISVVGILLTLAIVPLTAHTAYILGYKQVSISEKIIYVDPDKRNRRRRRRY